MLQYMDYVQNAFQSATSWNPHNSYATLTATARALLDFPTPRGLRMNLSSLSSPNFATSYSLGNFGVVDGSVSYLYSSLPLNNVARSSNVDLHLITEGYRQLEELRAPEDGRYWEVWQGGNRIDRRDTLIFGRMYLPASTLEALYLRRMTPTQQFMIKAVSDARLKSGGAITAMFQTDVGKWSSEYLYSTDGALIGVRGLYNFGRDPRTSDPPVKKPPVPFSEEKAVGRFSAGAELYYGILNKSAGMSTGFRYTTLPTHPGTPLTMTLTLNPLIGHLSATYAVRAGESAAFCSRFEFNMYSYESDLAVGCELWRRRSAPPSTNCSSPSKQKAEEKLFKEEEGIKDDFAGVLKARVSHNSGIGLLWEGRIKHLLFSIGASIDMRRRDQPVRALGLEVMYSS
ncbi:Mitochondrial distribution and morphology protein 10 [Rhizina undulata]